MGPHSIRPVSWLISLCIMPPGSEQVSVLPPVLACIIFHAVHGPPFVYLLVHGRWAQGLFPPSAVNSAA